MKTPFLLCIGSYPAVATRTHTHGYKYVSIHPVIESSNTKVGEVEQMRASSLPSSVRPSDTEEQERRNFDDREREGKKKDEFSIISCFCWMSTSRARTGSLTLDRQTDIFWKRERRERARKISHHFVSKSSSTCV